MTRNELLEKLRNIEETSLLELLNISSEELVDAFIDRILENEEYLELELREDAPHGFEEE